MSSLRRESAPGPARRVGRLAAIRPQALWRSTKLGFLIETCGASESLPDQTIEWGRRPARTNPAGQPWAYPVLDPRWLCIARPFSSELATAGLRFVRGAAGKDAGRVRWPAHRPSPWDTSVRGSTRADRTLPCTRFSTERAFASPDLTRHIPDPRDQATKLRRTARPPIRPLRRRLGSCLTNEQESIRHGVLFDVTSGNTVRAHRRPGRRHRLPRCLSTCPLPLRQS